MMNTSFDILRQGVVFHLNRGAEVSIKAQYSCMTPIINDGDRVIIKKLNRKMHIGDIVLVDQQYRFVIHRILKIYPDGACITAGDNSVIHDAITSNTMILGVCIGHPKRRMLSLLYRFISSIIAKLTYLRIKMIEKDGCSRIVIMMLNRFSLILRRIEVAIG